MPIDEQTQQLLDGKTEIGIANAPLLQVNRFETIYRKRDRLIALFHKDSPYLNGNKPHILLHAVFKHLQRFTPFAAGIKH